MALIRQVVRQTLAVGYLTLEAENQLRQLLSAQCEEEDLDAFLSLQFAVLSGIVRQESRELRQGQPWRRDCHIATIHACCDLDPTSS